MPLSVQNLALGNTDYFFNPLITNRIKLDFKLDFNNIARTS